MKSYINKAKEVSLKNWRIFSNNYQLTKKITTKDKSVLSSFQRKEAKEFWSNYTKRYNIDYCSYYTSRSNNYDYRYVPDGIYFSVILPNLNNSKVAYGYTDKAYYDFLFPNLKSPNTILRKVNSVYYDSDYNILSENLVSNNLLSNKEYIIKPSLDTGGGKDIIFTSDINNVNKWLRDNNNYIVQEIIEQHGKLKSIHGNSINSIRVVSLLIDDKVEILSSVLRVGVNGSKIDNFSAGGLACGIQSDGILKKKAYSIDGMGYDVHPQGFVFEGFKVPGYQAVIDTIKNEAKKFARFKLISWDFAVSPNEDPIFIELNLLYSAIDLHQLCNGPIFGKYTEKVLDSTFDK